MCSSLASRLLDEDFNKRLETWYKRLDDRFSAFMCNGVVSGLHNDAFNERMELLLDGLGKDNFVTFIGNGAAKAIEDDAGNQRVIEWHVLLGDSLCTFMCSSVASRLKDPCFLPIATRWIDRLGREEFSKIFERGSFVKRIVEKPKFEEKVMGHFVRLGSVAKALTSFLNKNDGCKLDDI